ncbi:MAG TPA: T9SS type A sorting domain-containing protein [Bacteroidia bacterium]|jgi:hypothetical protein|nr:T9SS type A sorting domain-containing protein [Bacteroidia bacterium]
MKNFKQILRNASMAFGIFILCNNGHAAVIVSNGYTYYMCAGSTVTFECDAPSGDFIAANGSGYSTAWSWGGTACSQIPQTINGYTISSFSAISACSSANYTAYQATVTPNVTNSMSVTVSFLNCSSGTSDGSITFTIVPYYTSISGTTDFCHTSNETYTCTTTVPGVGANGYTWSIPSFLSGTSTTNTDATTTTGTGSGTISVTVSSSGCPTGSASMTNSLALNSYPSPGTPGGTLVYQEEGNTCYYNANIPSVTGAEYYQWSPNSSFSTFYCAETTSPTTTGSPFYEDTHYDIYVRVLNSCGTGTYHEYMGTTPTKDGCIQIREDKADDRKSVLEQTVYKVYPNPASSKLTIEYPVSSDNSELTLSVYDMLGQKVVTWNLPASTNIMTEDTSGFPVGLYVYVISSGNEILERGKILIQR